jgi:hypothetical protein
MSTVNSRAFDIFVERRHFLSFFIYDCIYLAFLHGKAIVPTLIAGWANFARLALKRGFGEIFS